MSVTSLVRDPKFLKRLRSIYPASKLVPTGDVQIPRSHERGDHIGTAFDYLYRLVIARAAGMPYTETSTIAGWAESSTLSRTKPLSAWLCMAPEASASQ